MLHASRSRGVAVNPDFVQNPRELAKELLFRIGVIDENGRRASDPLEYESVHAFISTGGHVRHLTHNVLARLHLRVLLHQQMIAKTRGGWMQRELDDLGVCHNDNNPAFVQAFSNFTNGHDDST